MTGDRPGGSVAVAAALVLAAGTRLFPLWWSPLPATLDGILYARRASETLAAGHVPLEGFRADAFGSTVLLSAASAVTGVAPLRLAQPLYALVGAATVLLGIAFARRLGRDRGWSARRVRWAGVLAAFALAVDGLFVRRTGVPDDDALTLLVVPLVALATLRYLRTGRRAWVGVLAAFLVVLPLVHTFSTLVAALALAALLAAWAGGSGGRVDRRTLVAGAAVVGFWAYFAGYYAWAQTTPLVVPYVGRIVAHPGLFLAWLVALVVGTPWFQRASARAERAWVCVALGLCFAVVAANARVAVFPGTARTPRVVLALVAPLAVPALLAAWASPLLGRRDSAGSALLALFAAPLVLVLFSLTAALTPEFAATAMRAQTHLHLPVLVLAAAVVTGYATAGSDGRSWTGTTSGSGVRGYVRPALAAALVVAVAATLPVAYVDLDTGAHPSTTTPAEFAAATFAVEHVPARWTSGHAQTRMATNYYAGANATVGPTAVWLRGGPSPACPVLSRRSWTTTGAHLFPLAPETVPPDAYDRWLARRDLVYAAGGPDRLVLTIPRGSTAAGC